MAYLEEVSGKIKQRTLLIGDGVDKVHSPLQVAPQMATDMLNLTSAQYPSLSVRDSLTSKGYLNFYPDIGSPEGEFLAMCDPFVAANGDVHYCYVNNVDSVTLPTLSFRWYVMKSGATVPVHKYTNTFGLGAATIPASETYATGNFTEYKGIVYFAYNNTFATSPPVANTYILKYTPATETVTSTSETISDISAKVLPCAVYLEKLYLGSDSVLAYSVTGILNDFTATTSGEIPLAQGGIITTLTPLRDRLLISTKTSLFLLMGTDFTTFQIMLLADNIGIPNPKCVTSMNGVAYFAASDGDIYEYDGNDLLNITREPTDTGSRSGVKGGFLNNVLLTTSISVNKYVLYCVSSDGNTYCFDLIKRRWYMHLYAPTVAVTAGDFVTDISKYVVFQNNNLQYFLFYRIQHDSLYIGAPSRIRVVTQLFLDDAGIAELNIPFTWQSPAYQLNPTGKQSLKAIHLTYYAPVGTTVGIYLSSTVDVADFVKITTLLNSKQKQNSRTVIPVKNNKMGSWLRIKIQGTGNIIIYNMTLEWRILDRAR